MLRTLHRSPITRLGALPALAGAAAIVTAASLPVLCPFRLCTGHACPGCGLSRSIGALVRGDVALSWRYHPLAIVVLVQVAVASFLLARQPDVELGDFVTRHLRWIYANIALLLIVWIVRWRLGALDLVLDRY